MKNKLLFSFMLVCVVLFIYQGVTLGGITGKIAGIITDASTGEQLPAVNVVIEGTTLGGATDNEGHYFIINIPPGTYSLQASMVGYAVESKTGIIVNVDHTTPIDFNLRVTAIAGEEITVTAEREIVPMDITASQIVADAEQIAEVPMITDIAQYIHLQAGIEGNYIRGGGLSQTQFMMDGLTVVDNRTNQPMMMVNLSAMKELNIIKGGFNAEYGNVRSGLINVITKEGSPSIYHGSMDFRYSPAHYKHQGPNMYSMYNYWNRPYLDPDVCWDGTEAATEWDGLTGDDLEYMKNQYLSFVGWNEWAAGLPADKAMTAEEGRNLYMWEHLSEGCAALGQKEKKYGHKPDWVLDASFGGPIPYIGKYLGDLSFFISHRNNWELFRFPATRDYYKEQNTNFKVTSRLGASMKLTLEGLYTDINTLEGTPSGTDFLLSNFPPYDIYRSMVGIAFDHVLSPRTFYNVRISYVHAQENNPHATNDRDMSIKEYFGLVGVNESPWGDYEITDQWTFSPPNDRVGGGGYNWDFSSVNTWNIKADLTSQVDKYNQLKVGFTFNYDDINEYKGHVRGGWPVQNWTNDWGHIPYRGGGYIQNKLEFEGMIANLGLRLDYNEPNTDWYTVDRYSEYFSAKYKDVFEEEAPKEPASGHLKISPRLGISHPISDNAKLYFNYGHFYSMPSSNNMYIIRYRGVGRGIYEIGNPSADLPKTVSYELGVEYNIRNLFLIHLSGYYKDSRDQTSSVRYVNYTGTVDYNTYENNNFSDVRGFELRLDKRFGRWITGWLNYNYMVTSSGYIGRKVYYEDLRMQRLTGLQTPYPKKPLARPVFRANANIRTPLNWGPGPTVGGGKLLGDLQVSFLFTWKAGSYMTWDPLETYELINNLQWKGRKSMDMRVSKRVRFGKYSVQVFADINNPFNWKYLRSGGFADDTDSRRYYDSLQLPMYDDPKYIEAGCISGDDKPGDIGGPGTDKPYIDMPNRTHLTYFDVRTFFIGFKVDF